MVVDDLEACLQAYRFAELLLAGWHDKREKEREEALAAAQRLRDEVEPRYAAALASSRYDEARLGSLRATRSKLDEELARKL
ncbi:MAG: hypothetical protein EOO73_13850 [Myxococcales bacterium]|nr:MAG: hypothetical protein EOO73_13850 [Myxococcales bacterium]